MPTHAGLGLPAIAALAISFSLSILSPDTAANAAGSCLTAPKLPGPQGSRWYYRIERPSMRKCWHLVQQDRKHHGPARTAAQDEPDEQSEPAPPLRSATAGPPAAPAATPAPAAQSWVTESVSNTTDNTPLATDLADAAQPETTSRVEAPRSPEPPAQSVSNEPAPAAMVEQPTARADALASDDPNGGWTLRLFVGAVALLGFMVGAVFLLMALMRRRGDVLNNIARAERPRAAPPPRAPATRAPTFAPLQPIELELREDDVADALRRFAQRRRRAA